ncbi:MAG: hypothetical protein ACYCVD_16320 [Desulfitobacteriaceae bacterium]
MDGLMPRAHGRAGAAFTCRNAQRLGALAKLSSVAIAELGWPNSPPDYSPMNARFGSFELRRRTQTGRLRLERRHGWQGAG